MAAARSAVVAVAPAQAATPAASRARRLAATERDAHPLAGRIDQPAARALELAGRRRAMHVIDRGDLIDAEAIDHGVAQQVSLARCELADRLGERGAASIAVVPPQV